MRNRNRRQSIFVLAIVCTVQLVALGSLNSQEVPAKKSDDAKTKPRANRLAGESSPYLLLHAHNPVDWYPWGPEALEKAQREKKPIFLSIGYSSCYWCHVMERQVFTNEKIARYMNENFINIKVDREERPDIDDIYMTALTLYFQAIRSPQGGGWPLSMFLTSEGKPFAGGTYFPPEDNNGRLGFLSVLGRIETLWSKNHDDILANAKVLTQQVQRVMKPRVALSTMKIERSLVSKTGEAIRQTYDKQYGGLNFNPARPNTPKFPSPAKLGLLQYEIRRHADAESEKILYHTLDALASGGIYDHLGGGFHRYSTDRYWHVPHFEKMLYDNAQLADIYVEAFRKTNKALYRETAEGIFDYVTREMTDPRGGFYSSLDAETDGIEGKFYVWSKDEIDETLSVENAKLFKQIYGFGKPNPFEHGFVLHLPEPVENIAKRLNVSLLELKQNLSASKQKLLQVRNKREKPLLDDKTLTAWNALMIRAFANGSAVLGRKDYLEVAQKAAIFIISDMRDSDGKLYRTYRAGKAKLPAYLDDYAFFSEALLTLHRVTGDNKWLNAARKMTDDQIEMFWDKTAHGFFFTSHGHEELIARTKNSYDSIFPSGNSVSARSLLRLASLTGEPKYRTLVEQLFQAFAGSFQASPRGMANLALAMGEYLDDPDFKSQPRRNLKSSSLGPTTARRETVQLASAQKAADDQPKKKAELVSAKAFLEFDKLPAGKTCQVVLVIDIKDGWHINTNPANPDFLVPTKFTIKSKLKTKLINVKYPGGKKLTIPGFEQPIHVYEKRVLVRGELQVPATAAGQSEEIEIQVRYQPCNDKQCKAPATLKLNGKIPVAAQGKPVKKININLFSKETK